MNPRVNDGGLSLPLRTTLSISSLATERDNRHHDRCPGYVYRGVAISVIRIAALLTDKGGLILAVRFLAVSTHTTRLGGVGRVYRLERNASKSGLVGKELTELSERPTALLCTLRASNRASFPNVP
jgi:hypothetical protein